MLAAGIDSHITLVKGRTFANPATHPQANYSKIPIISPGAYFLSKGLFEKNFLGEGGGDGLYSGGGLIHEQLQFFLRFSIQYLSLLLIFSHFNF